MPQPNRSWRMPGKPPRPPSKETAPPTRTPRRAGRQARVRPAIPFPASLPVVADGSRIDRLSFGRTAPHSPRPASSRESAAAARATELDDVGEQLPASQQERGGKGRTHGHEPAGNHVLRAAHDFYQNERGIAQRKPESKAPIEQDRLEILFVFADGPCCRRGWLLVLR